MLWEDASWGVLRDALHFSQPLVVSYKHVALGLHTRGRVKNGVGSGTPNNHTHTWLLAGLHLPCRCQAHQILGLG